MSLALDSSATLAWIFGDETTGSIEEVFEMVANYGAYAPGLPPEKWSSMKYGF